MLGLGPIELLVLLLLAGGGLWFAVARSRAAPPARSAADASLSHPSGTGSWNWKFTVWTLVLVAGLVMVGVGYQSKHSGWEGRMDGFVGQRSGTDGMSWEDYEKVGQIKAATKVLEMVFIYGGFGLAALGAFGIYTERTRQDAG